MTHLKKELIKSIMWLFVNMVATIIIVITILACLFSCRTVKAGESEEVKDTTDIRSVKIERADGVKISKSVTDISSDRIRLLVVNEKGDTVREKETLVIKEIYEQNDSVAMLMSMIDSLMRSNSHNSDHDKVIVKQPNIWQKVCSEWLGPICLAVLVLIAIALIRRR